MSVSSNTAILEGNLSLQIFNMDSLGKIFPPKAVKNSRNYEGVLVPISALLKNLSILSSYFSTYFSSNALFKVLYLLYLGKDFKILSTLTRTSGVKFLTILKYLSSSEITSYVSNLRSDRLNHSTGFNFQKGWNLKSGLYLVFCTCMCVGMCNWGWK